MDFACLSVQGPNSRNVLQAITDTSLENSEFKFLPLADIAKLPVSMFGYKNFHMLVNWDGKYLFLNLTLLLYIKQSKIMAESSIFVMLVCMQ